MKDMTRRFAAVGVLVVLGLAGLPGQQPPARTYRPITADRLKNPDDGDWLMVRRTYDGWGYSPLEQITPATSRGCSRCGRLPPAQANGHEAPPIVNSGVMFVATPGNQVIALDAKTGAAALALPAAVARRRRAAASHQPRRGAATATKSSSPRARPCSWRSTPRPARRSGRRDGGRQQPGLLHVTGAAGGRRQGDGRRVRRRIRHPRFRRRRTTSRPAKERGRRTRFRSGRAGQRDVAERRSMEDRRRVDVGHRQLRSRDEPRVLGHRQRRTVDGRSTAWRQSLYLVDDRDRCRNRRASRATSNITRTNRGIGTRCRRRFSSITVATAERSRGSSTWPATAISGSSSAPTAASTSSKASRT